MKRFLITCRLFAVAGAFSIPSLLSADVRVQPGEDQPKREQPRDEKPKAENPREQLNQILELQKEIAEAVRGNDPQKALELMTKLQQLMRVERGGGQFQLQFQPRGGRGEPAPLPKSDLRQQYEKQLKEFADSIEKLKDDKEAREAIEKARDEYKKAMEAELKKADKADAERPVPQPLPFPDFRRIERPQIQPILPFPQLDFDNPRGRLNGSQPRLGVRLEKPSAVLIEQLDLPANVGIVFTEVIRGMPAEKAGLKTNDILVQWAGKDVSTDVEQFQAMIAGAKAGEKFEAVVIRKGKKETIKGIELPEGRRLAPGVNFNQLQVQLNGNSGELTATSDGVKYEISVDMVGRRPDPVKFTITDGDAVTKYDSLEKIPEKYKPTVEKLLTRIRGF